MKAETLIALKKSIDHWERLSNGTQSKESVGSDDCALCLEFFDLGCDGCPVKEKTGRRYCLDTPFNNAEEYHWEFGLGSEQFKSAAKEELEFLKSLLPK